MINEVTQQLAAIVEHPISLEALLRQTNRTPMAATVALQTLRLQEGLPVEQALQLESLAYGLLQGSQEHATWLAARASPGEALPLHGCIQTERIGPTLHVTLNRPAARNAINRTLRDELFEAFTLASMDNEILEVNLTAIGKAFCIGGDLGEFGTTRDPATAHQIRSQTLPAIPLAQCANKVTVHVQGACIGAGVEIAAFAKKVTAEPDAWFQLPELEMGLIPGAGGCVSIPRRIGCQRAALMILSGRRINAETALRWGLIDEIAPYDRRACPVSPSA